MSSTSRNVLIIKNIEDFKSNLSIINNMFSYKYFRWIIQDYHDGKEIFVFFHKSLFNNSYKILQIGYKDNYLNKKNYVKLEEELNNILIQIGSGITFCKFDIKFQDEEELLEGKNIKILEINYGLPYCIYDDNILNKCKNITYQIGTGLICILTNKSNFLKYNKRFIFDIYKSYVMLNPEYIFNSAT